MFGIGPMELVLILVVALLVLGPKRMPELARTLGKGLGEFRRASNDLRQSLALDEIQNELRDGLASAGSIHKPVKKPEAEDRPPQAGDELAAGAEPSADERRDAAEAGAGGKHPGELPDDLDPHAHADAPEDGDEDRHDEPSAEAAGSDAPRPSAEAAGDAPGPRARAADDGVGAVPVGRTVTPRRTVEANPAAAPTDDERG